MMTTFSRVMNSSTMSLNGIMSIAVKMDGRCDLYTVDNCSVLFCLSFAHTEPSFIYKF